ncbi:hypothetical protein SPRG_00705 [Saprolegnia parasitica CBS 223.65]|uniref:F-box/LRR-repeat protein 15-like leucin rich repeat domain-containing protein n=1 Tax=Saprolegnia parasitica (strain CBS 223.65) TaxID=695850 RepID=A0A067CVX0_SAPPC|nr:hypothetical protein SPRG_00705 [Saprolegnia parasitica CBS 223.65]KDO34643.1 hypothetical protein SPRG_00705 [Saprolegnia parasitica CBS 223.65]|eukprot:XP_012194317.1 hypothetical protein SPRG_00705 [Saprolegnia parasitica CBS 223.65]
MSDGRLSAAAEGDGFAALSSATLAHVLGYLDVRDKVRFLSTSRTNAREPLVRRMQSFCGACDACKAKTEYLCASSRERVWTAETWASIFQRFGRGIEELHLVGCDGIEPSVFESPEALAMLQNIVVLRLERCANLPVASIAKLAQFCTRLREVRLHDLGIDDATVSAIVSANASTLRVLDLQGCHAITGTCLNAVGGSAVEDLSLQNCHNVAMTHLEAAAPLCGHMKRLNLRFCHKVTDSVVACIAKHMPLLEDVNLRYCYKMTDAAVSALCAGTPKLRSLNLSQCWRLTDAAIWELAKSLSLLKELRLWGCMKLTSSSVVACLTLPSLTLVDIRSRDKLEAVIGGFSTVKHVMESHRSTLLKWEQSGDKVGVFHRKAFVPQRAQVLQRC